MELNIYKGNDVVKTYETESFRLKYRVTKKLIKLLDLGSLVNIENLNEDQMISLIEPIIGQSDELISEIMMDMFPEMTSDELDNTDSAELVYCIYEAAKYVIQSFINLKSKN